MLALALAIASIQPIELVEVDWGAPAGCPGGEAVKRAIEDRVDDALSAAAASVRGRVTGRSGAWHLDLEVRTGSAVERRRVDDRNCATLVDAAALIVAVAIEKTPGRPSAPVLRALAPSTPTAMVWPELPPPRSGGELTDAAPPKEDRDTKWRPGVRVAAGVEVGALPGVGADIGVAALLQRGRFAAEVGGRYEPPRKARYPEADGAGGDLSLWAIQGAVCFAPAAGRVRFPWCVGAEGGGMFGRGIGLAQSERDHLPWGAGQTKAGITVQLQPWIRVAANAGLLVPWTRPRFSTDSRGVVHRAGAVAGRFNLGIELVPGRRKRP